MKTKDTIWIEFFLKESKLSRKEAAKALDIHYNTLCNYARGARDDGTPAPTPRVVKLAMIALLNCNIPEDL